jgi:hypothetical protein
MATPGVQPKMWHTLSPRGETLLRETFKYPDVAVPRLSLERDVPAVGRRPRLTMVRCRSRLSRL